MTLHKITSALLIMVLFVSSSFAAEGAPDDAYLKDISSSQKVFGFADSLFENRDYYRAITEYKRFIFLFPKNPLSLNAKYKIGLSYLKGEKYEDAIEVFIGLSTLEEKGEITKKALFKLAEAYFKNSGYQESAETYERFLKEYPNSLEADNAKYKLSWSYLYDDEYEKAKENFDSIEQGNPFYSMSQNVSSEMTVLKELPHKSPRLAGGLSAVIPGAGQLYCGREKDAAVSFILNGLFIWGTVEMFEGDHYAAGGVLAFFSLMWYSGNIFSAISSAHKFNRDVKAESLEKLNSKYNLSLKHDGAYGSNFLVLNLKF